MQHWYFSDVTESSRNQPTTQGFLTEMAIPCWHLDFHKKKKKKKSMVTPTLNALHSNLHIFPHTNMEEM